ncbi:hypothetical protein SBOR_3509 [Sclerotinia borealis F-4128]|uniref:Uncharacterized protein n=1 Tax=Sclerotinia borealis (strain F-4128) TaxID=1432307 RepID=W9CNN9_SCLBF|nr:hypothetical protein SBOR_3509 [Sclerotinia borealis F-4128]
MEISFQRSAWCWVRVVAVDGKGGVLETSTEVDAPDTEEVIEVETEAEKPLMPSRSALDLIAIAGFAFGMLEFWRRNDSKRIFSNLGYSKLPVGNEE